MKMNKAHGDAPCDAKTPEVITNLSFVMIPTMPIKLRGEIEIYQRGRDGDNDHSGVLLNGIRSMAGLDKCSNNTTNDIIIIMNYSKAIKVSRYKSSFFSSTSTVV